VPRSIEAYNEVSPYVTVSHIIIMEEPTEEAEASGIPTASVIDIDINDPNLDQYPTFTVRRKAAERSERWYNDLESPPPLPPPMMRIPARRSRATSTGQMRLRLHLPQDADTDADADEDEDMPARKKPRLEKPIATARREATTKAASPNIAMDIPPPTATEDTSIRRSSRRKNIISSTATPDPSAAVNASTRRQSPRNTQTQLLRTETSEAQLDGDDDATTVDHDEDTIAVVGDSSCPSWEDRLSQLADYRKINGHCNIPKIYSENTKLGRWVATQRTQYRYHREGNRSSMTLPRIQALESLDFEWARYGGTATWEGRLSELAEYRKIQGHCNVPKDYSKNIQLANWVRTQRIQYRLQREGKTSSMTLSRFKALESLGFEWVCVTVTWEERLSELAEYRKIHGHCNVPRNYSKNIQLANWVRKQKQRSRYGLQQVGKTSSMTFSRIQELESLGFEWVRYGATASWEDRLSELADYRKINGHCNVPQIYSENTKLGKWVKEQRRQYRFHREGKTSSLTLSRIQALERLNFEWARYGATAAWEDRLSELADYRKIHGHCNVPTGNSENTKLANWVKEQRRQYRFHREGNTSSMTLSRIQALERLGFEWVCVTVTWEERLSELAEYRKIHGHCNVPRNYSKNIQLANWIREQRFRYGLQQVGKTSSMTFSRIQELESLGFEWGRYGTKPRRG
jgi:hypothetical protein